MSKDFDLSQYELNETALLTIQTPQGDDMLVNGKPVVFNLYGTGSSQFVSARRKSDEAATGRVQAMFRGKTVKNAAEQNDRELAVKLAACTASIENFPVSAIDVYSNPKLGYITSQVIQFLEDDANFTKNSTKA